MPERIMFIQLKTGHDLDRGPSWIERVRFSQSWRTASFRGHTLARVTGTARANVTEDANFYALDTGERFWVSGPTRDRTDTRYSRQPPTIAAEVRAEYQAFLAGAPLPGRERG